MDAVTIARIEAIPVELPVRRPLEMAVATVNTRTCIVVRLTTTDGVVGYGEAVLARYFSGEGLASAVDLISGVYADVFTGEDATRIDGHRNLMARISVYNQGARAAVEMAMHDAVARTAGIPLHKHFGDMVRSRVPTIWHVSGGGPEEMAAEAAEAVAANSCCSSLCADNEPSDAPADSRPVRSKSCKICCVKGTGLKDVTPMPLLS